MNWKLEEPRTPPCHHIWLQEKTEVDEELNLKRLTHKCPKCGYVKTTTRMLHTKVRT